MPLIAETELIEIFNTIRLRISNLLERSILDQQKQGRGDNVKLKTWGRIRVTTLLEAKNNKDQNDAYYNLPELEEFLTKIKENPDDYVSLEVLVGASTLSVRKSGPDAEVTEEWNLVDESPWPSTGKVTINIEKGLKRETWGEKLLSELKIKTTGWYYLNAFNIVLIEDGAHGLQVTNIRVREILEI